MKARSAVATGPVVRRRLAVMMAVFLVLFAVIAARLVRLQVFEAHSLQRRAQAQWTRESVVTARRGPILDRNGTVLAVSATAYIASVSPRQVSDPRAFAELVAPVLGMEADTVQKRASDRGKGGVTLKRQLGQEVARQLLDMIKAHERIGSPALKGLYLEEDAKRYYPLGDAMSQLIGLTTVDGVGQSGLEKTLNKYLSGKAGRVLDEIDGKGRSLDAGTGEYVEAKDGSSVTLTIDAGIQLIAEQAAREAMTVNGAKSVRVLVMDPNTGEILAMCSRPGFDLNNPPRNDVDALNELMRNRVIADAYEPGSTFKIITTASALEAGVTRVSEGFYCSGSTVVEGGRIRCWGRPHGAQTMAQALQNSCNPVFVELGLRLGVGRFYDYLDAFGLGKVTGVDIAGESAGILIPRERCKRVDIARIGFGQSVSVTPLQLLTAQCAAINGGNLLVPYIVKEVRAPDGTLSDRGARRVAGHPISAKTSETMRTLLEDVVTRGGGKNAYLAGYRVGGKTGTAQLYVNGVVSSQTHIGSFVGFAPMNDPRIAVMVIVDEATARPDFGSVTAAPFAKQIIERTLRHLGVPREGAAELKTEKAAVPDVRGMDTDEALRVLRRAKLSALLDGTGQTVREQTPAPGVEMAEQSLITLHLDGADADCQRVTVPDVYGLSIAEANRLLASYGLTLKMRGSGVAVAQTPAAGEQAAPTASVSVRFEMPE